jgi:hypothetical protein
MISGKALGEELGEDLSEDLLCIEPRYGSANTKTAAYRECARDDII